ncbi:hypothetical protein B0T17DRAFT_36342 [Bombardia bombarda]|uniref:glycogenin glucosyltransferase n=1 Tax=Bombardia bombarda TaxID=252184 RepID=A0AA40CFB4_9PEZI|nr:hypothetical protein B0T17DRAFT_36342 [Bombardia bombarda]
MAAPEGEDVYASLLLTDAYLPGALVLAHSLRDAGTTKKLAILVTLDTISAEVVTQLKAVYDYVIPVGRIRNEKPANLYLMNRPDLHSAFTKVNLWKQTQFRKIVYLDADVVAYRAPDELFDIPHAFSAAPDIGWPDLFNTGVMVLTPNMGDYYALMAMAERGISFDGADQGLLNMHFKHTYHRLSFTYNVTPSAHYQYVPAFRHFQSSINMVHFIGSEKPWTQGRDKSIGSSPFDEIVGRWWAVYDRHYRREPTPSQPAQAVPELVQYFVKGEYHPPANYFGSAPTRTPATSVHGQHYQNPTPSAPLQFQHQHHQQLDFYYHMPSEPPQNQHHAQHHTSHASHDVYHDPHRDAHPPAPSHHYVHHDQHHEPQRHEEHREPPHHQDQHHEPPPPHHQDQYRETQHHDQYHEQHHHHHEQSHSGSSDQTPPEHAISLPSESFRSEDGNHTEAREGQEPTHQQWASHSPPQEHKPERAVISDVPSWDAQRQPPPTDSKPEAHNFPQTHYEMSSDPAPFVPPERYPSPPKNMWYEVPKERPAPPRQKPNPIFPWEASQPRASRVFLQHEEPTSPDTTGKEGDASAGSHPQSADESSSPVEQKSEPETPTTPGNPPSDPWSSFTRTNAWDDVPQISRYVDAIQKHRRTRSQGPGLIELPTPGLGLGRGQESSWGRRGGSRVTDFPSEDDRPSLPVTPAPIRRPKFWGGGAPGIGLGDDESEKLPAAEGVPAQSDWDPVAQLQKLAKQQSDLLLQKLGGSGSLGQEVIGTEGREIPSRSLPFGSENARSPTYVAPSSTVLSPKPVKPDAATSSVRNIMSTGHDETVEHSARPTITVTEPSYRGPGVSFDKGEDYPTYETPALPTEEEKDVLET